MLVQYSPLFWKMLTLNVFTTSFASIAMYLICDTSRVSNGPPLGTNSAVPLLTAQVILPIPADFISMPGTN